MGDVVRRQVNFRLTEDELAIVEKNAQEANLTISKYCKCMSVEGKVKPQVINKEQGKIILAHISRMGSNINQIAKKVNEGDTVAAQELKRIQKDFGQLFDYILHGRIPIWIKSCEDYVPDPKRIPGEEAKYPPVTCQWCGRNAVIRFSKNYNRSYWICPNYSKQEHGHFFQWRDE